MEENEQNRKGTTQGEGKNIVSVRVKRAETIPSLEARDLVALAETF